MIIDGRWKSDQNTKISFFRIKQDIEPRLSHSKKRTHNFWFVFVFIHFWLMLTVGKFVVSSASIVMINIDSFIFGNESGFLVGSPATSSFSFQFEFRIIHLWRSIRIRFHLHFLFWSKIQVSYILSDNSCNSFRFVFPSHRPFVVSLLRYKN